jgi:long-subunit acyl-CoA synthetase (AMP-forming)
MTTSTAPMAKFASGIAPVTLTAAFQRSVALYADRVALRQVGRDEEISWEGYARRVQRAAARLAALGIGRGDTVALLLTNRPEAAWFDVAAMHLGATTVSLYVASSAADLEHMLIDSGATVVVTESALAARIQALRHACPALRHVFAVDGEDQGTESADGGFDLEAHSRNVSPDDVVCLLYTSGTTGPPKAVQHTHATMLAIVREFEAASPEQPSVEYVSFLPLAHLGERGIGHYRALLRGSTTTFCPDPDQLPAALAEARPTWLFGPPRIWRRLQAAGEAIVAAGVEPRAALARLGLDRLEHAITAAAPCPPEVHDFFLALGVPFAELYGMTETGAVTMTRPDLTDVGTVGRALPGVDLRLAQNGEVLVRGAAVTPGYHGRPEATAALIDPDGWVHTGDVGTLDSHGRLRIVDRLKELIVSDAGHNMSPARIEARLVAAGPLIAHACAIGDGRPYNIALLALDPEAAGRLAGMPGAGPAVLARAPIVLAEVASAVARANEALDERERIVRHVVLPTTWMPGDDVLTPTSKLRRRSVATIYADEIDALYAPGARAEWPADRSAPLLDVSVGDLLRETDARAPDAIALVEGAPDPEQRRRWTYAELLEQSERAARALLGRFDPGDRVAIRAGNIPEWVILELAAGLAGITIVPVDPALRAEELAHVLGQSQAHGIFVAPELHGDLPRLREVVSFADWEEFCATASPDRGLPDVDPEWPAQILYASGRRAGVALHHRGIVNNARLSYDRLGAEPGLVQLSSMPLFHATGGATSVLGSIACAGTLVLPPCFDPGLVLALAESERVGCLVGAPAMLAEIVEHPRLAGSDMSCVRLVVTGGTDVPPALVRRAEAALGARVSIVLARAEASPVITQTAPDDDPEDRATTLGRPLARTEVKIVDVSSGETVAPGVVGELCTRGYHVMVGYYDDPEGIAAAIDAERWLHTGVLASMDARGYCTPAAA